MKEALIYAGAFVVALLLVWLLPLGFSRLGGFATVAVSMLAAWLAQISSSVVPLWQTVLLVLLLLAAISYLLDRRFGALLYRDAPHRALNLTEDGNESEEAGWLVHDAFRSMPAEDRVSLRAVELDQEKPLLKNDEQHERERFAEEERSVDAMLMEEAVVKWDQTGEENQAPEPLRWTSDWLDEWPVAVTLDLEAAVLRDEPKGERKAEWTEMASFDLSSPASNDGHGEAQAVGDDEKASRNDVEGAQADAVNTWMNIEDVLLETVDMEDGNQTIGREQKQVDNAEEEHSAAPLEAATASNVGPLDAGEGNDAVVQDDEQLIWRAGSDSVAFVSNDGSAAEADEENCYAECLARPLNGWSHRVSDASAIAVPSVEERDGGATSVFEQQNRTTGSFERESLRPNIVLSVEKQANVVPSDKAQMAAAELILNRRRLTAVAYEECLQQCLQAPLSDRDYYVFARLLLEHYALERKYDQLVSWAEKLERRFSGYPAVAAELEFWREMAATLANS
ncbi:hypothetical protein V2J23_01445 [Geobacillus thermoleovorans]|uniref:hypothetical protein n=1 Tax=Geobacillus thermoleovorans TaxID=33941 RepID=UPI00345C4B6B